MMRDAGGRSIDYLSCAQHAEKELRTQKLISMWRDAFFLFFVKYLSFLGWSLFFENDQILTDKLKNVTLKKLDHPVFIDYRNNFSWHVSTKLGAIFTGDYFKKKE